MPNVNPNRYALFLRQLAGSIEEHTVELQEWTEKFGVEDCRDGSVFTGMRELHVFYYVTESEG